MNRETFAVGSWISSQAGRKRVIGVAALTTLSLSAVVVLWRLSAANKHLLFDLGTATIFAAALYLVARRMIVAEARRHHRVAVAILMGVTAAAATLGVFALSVSGTSIGYEQLPALIVIQLIGATLGTTLGFPAALIATLLLDGAARLFGRVSAPNAGAWIGALTGLVCGLIVVAAGIPHLGGWFAGTAVVVCGTCGFRAAALHEATAKT